ncbi:hypothetical protein PC110_g9945 [Phytophthora cactorum]|uniref:Uncharacterized protein n=1 Tax=Phytophthora cactorum TaxID=29920 RepID=A0A329SA99_9STRA|nr:hypothetical protein PC110_g9945 [Phytophthora cactorum]
MMLSKTICALCVAAVAFSGSAVDASTEVAETFGWLLPKSYATYGGYGDAGAGANGYGGAAAGTSGAGNKGNSDGNTDSYAKGVAAITTSAPQKTANQASQTAAQTTTKSGTYRHLRA